MNDLISRQAAIAVADSSDYVGLSVEDVKKVTDEVVKGLKRLPSAQPKAIRPKFVAEDRFVKNYFATYPHCPKCNYELETGDCYCRVCGCCIDWSEEDG